MRIRISVTETNKQTRIFSLASSNQICYISFYMYHILYFVCIRVFFFLSLSLFFFSCSCVFSSFAKNKQQCICTSFFFVWLCFISLLSISSSVRSAYYYIAAHTSMLFSSSKNFFSLCYFCSDKYYDDQLKYEIE